MATETKNIDFTAQPNFIYLIDLSLQNVVATIPTVVGLPDDKAILFKIIASGVTLGIPNALIMSFVLGENGEALDQYVSITVGETRYIVLLAGKWYLVDSPLFLPNLVSISATYNILTSDYTINATSGTFTITAPTAIGYQGKIYIIKNSGSGTITLTGTSGQTFDGTASPTLSPGVSITIQSDNANWIII